MAMATTFAPLPEAEQSAQLRKAVIASTVGTTIEWYDFTAAGLVFGKLFFPNQEPLAATLAAFGTYFIGFAARPIGAVIFGHSGDRIGRKVARHMQGRPLSRPTTRARIYRRNMTIDDLSAPKTGLLCGRSQ